LDARPRPLRSTWLRAGRPAYIEGRLRVEEWTDRDGKARHTLEVHATDTQFIGGGNGLGERDDYADGSARRGETDIAMEEDDEPF
jgi:single-strand DNA-binding protein